MTHSPKRSRRDSDLSLESPTDEPLEVELGSNIRDPSDEEDEDPLNMYFKGLMGKGVDSSDESEENQPVETSMYQDLLDSIEEKMGSAIDAELASICKQIWGKALSNGNNKEELQKILIPSNCTTMKTPHLHTEIYIKINEGAQNKDHAAQTRQKEAVKTSVPILLATVELKRSEKLLRRT